MGRELPSVAWRRTSDVQGERSARQKRGETSKGRGDARLGRQYWHARTVHSRQVRKCSPSSLPLQEENPRRRNSLAGNHEPTVLATIRLEGHRNAGALLGV